ncbi:MAG: TIGR03986 family CRISPR-associated RAMP protein [Acidobacteria bacterium]|nr:TIGR03986 family CRISPR-associated RAMP protein [Acidobacteriota bacterium]
MPNLPKHKNPTHRIATAPYNFVPLPDLVVPATEIDKLPDHDMYSQNDYKHSGYFTVKLTTKSPLYIRCAMTRHNFELDEQEKDRNGNPIAPKANNTNYCDRIKNTPDFFYTQQKGIPVIPGSSLRGMLRSLLEIVSYGKLSFINKNNSAIFYRAVAAKSTDPLKNPYEYILGKYGKNVCAGYLVKKLNEWYIKPAFTPSELNIQENKSYLSIKDKYINNVSGFIKFNSENYIPQYHQISFDVKQQNNQLYFTNINATNSKYKGVLVCSGNMAETTDDLAKTPSKRTKHAIVLPAKDNVTPIKINEKAIEVYCDNLTPFQKEPPFDSKTGCLIEGNPIFYVEQKGEVKFFGNSPNFRVPAINEDDNTEKKVLDFLPSEIEKPQVIDYPETLFGYVKQQTKAKQGDKSSAYASRIFVTDALLATPNKNIWLSQNVIVPKILATPKPTAFQHYLTQQEPDQLVKLDHYGSPPPHETVLRGYKLYWHHNNKTADQLKAKHHSEDKTVDSRTASLFEQVNGRWKVKANSKQHTQFKPVNSGVEFVFTVHFENLSDREIGALCWILQPFGEEGKTYCHSLGMGKPFGMGAVELKATLHLIDRKTRYLSLFNDDSWQTGETEHFSSLIDRTVQEKYVTPFEKHILGYLGLKGQLKDVQRIGMLLKMLEWPGIAPSDAQYMHLDRFSERRVLPDAKHFYPELTNLTEPIIPKAELKPTPTIAKDSSSSSAKPITPNINKETKPNKGFEDKKKTQQNTFTISDRLNQANRPAPQENKWSGARDEKVTLIETIVRGKANVCTNAGEEVVCTDIPNYSHSPVGTKLTANITREGGKITKARFKKWV